MINLLNALGHNIKPAGRDKWTARCPVHNDKDFAMSIKQAADGSVLACCHACGANGLDLYQSLGLDLEELFGYRENEKKRAIPGKIVEDYELDKIVIMLYNNDSAAGKRISLTDKRRYKLAVARKKGIEEKFSL